MSQGWSKIFNRINWLNRPSKTTPVGATNLNKGDYALDKIDDRVITLDTIKADKIEVNGMVSDVSINESNGVITITYKDGSTKTYDTNLEKIAVNFDYDSETERLILTLPDGTKQYVDLSALITQYEFSNSSTIAFSVDSSGKVSASIKNGSITEAMLETGYLANIKVEVAKAEAAATQAQSSEASSDYNAKLSRSYAIGGSGIRDGEDTDNAMYYSQQAQASAESAISSKESASASANTATLKASEASTSATSAKNSADKAEEIFGSTDISSIGDGTATGAISTINLNLSEFESSIGYTAESVYPINRFNKSDYTPNLTINSAGNITSSDSTSISGLCDVRDLDSIKIYYAIAELVSYQNTYVLLYDGNKDKISSRIIGGNASNPVDVSTASYAQFVFNNGYENGMMICDGSLTITAYSEYFEPYVKFSAKRIDDIESEISHIKEQLVDSITITLDANGNGDFTSLRSAIESIKDSCASKPYIVNVLEGTYNVFADYSDDELSDESCIGIVLPEYVDIVGKGNRDKIIISGILAPDKNYQYSKISPINMSHVNDLKNITVISENCRYAVHDDPNTSAIRIKRKVENCNFIKQGTKGLGYTTAYGSGYRAGANIKFNNCDFKSSIGQAYSAHNNINFDCPASIVMENCNFHTDSSVDSAARFSTVANDYDTYLTLIGCSTDNTVLFSEEGGYEGAGCCYDVKGYANSDFGVSVTGTTEKNITNNNGIIRTQ